MGFSQLLKVNGSYQTLAPFKTNRWCFFVLFNIFLDFFPVPKTRANLPLSLSLRMKLFGDNRVACSVFLGFTGLEQRRIWALKQTVLQTTDGAGRLTSTYCQAWPPESVPRSHLVEGENQVLQVVLWCPHWHGGMNTCFLLPWPKEIDKWKQRDGRPHLKLLTREVGGRGSEFALPINSPVMLMAGVWGQHCGNQSRSVEEMKAYRTKVLVPK